MSRTLRVLGSCALACALGCAGIEAKPFYPGAREGLFGWGGEVEGIRFYEPTPVLIVTDENAKVAFVPNPARGVAVDFHTWLAKQKIEMHGEDGSLTKLVSDADSTAIPQGVLTLLENLGTEAIKNLDEVVGAAGIAALGEEVAGTITGKEGVYLFRFDSQGNFQGLDPVLR